MKTNLLLFIVLYCSGSLAAQPLSEVVTDQLLSFSEKVIALSQQEGLQPSWNMTVDSLQTALWNENSEQWQSQHRQFYYYEADDLQKASLLQYQSETDSWKPQSQTQYAYNSDNQLEKSIQQQWMGDIWQAAQQKHWLYTPEQVPVKEQRQLWNASSGTWQDYQIAEFLYQNDGKMSGIKTAEWQSNSQQWQNSDYQQMVYKSNHGWIDWLINQVWDSSENDYRYKNRWTLHYNPNYQILKQIDYAWFNPNTQNFVEDGKIVCHYNADFQLTALLFQQKALDSDSWQDIARCNLSWESETVTTTPKTTPNQLTCTLPNPLGEGAIIQCEGLQANQNYTAILHDLAGKLQGEQILPTDGTIQLPYPLSSGYYLLTVRDKKDYPVFQQRVIAIR